MRRLEALDLQVVLIMTRLRQAGERVLALQMRANGFKVKSRRSLQRALGRLAAQQILQHDLQAKVWVVDFQKAAAYCEDLQEYLAEQERLVRDLQIWTEKAHDQALVKGASWYSWTKVVKVAPKRRRGK